MALWGKGDPRWIVEERPDSKNVNNWHWTERDATSWSKCKLKELFLALKVENTEGKWNIKDVKKIEGEATINNRKGKLITFYEWALIFEYTGTVPGSDEEHTGTMEILNLSDENSPGDVDVQVISKGNSKNADILKQFIRKTGTPLCKETCVAYVKAMSDEYASGMVLPTKQNPAATNGKTNKDLNVKEEMRDHKVGETKSNKKQASSHHTISITEDFRTTADELYATLTDPQRISAFTRSKSESNVEIKGTFSIMSDNITGFYTELIPNQKIVQKWRFKEWPKDMHSTVTIELDQKDYTTKLKLTQTGVPDFDKKRTEDGWRQHFFGPIKQVFGYGSQLF